jgi:hypothetical protein
VISRPTDEDHDLIQKITSNLLDSIQNRKFHPLSPFFFCFLLYHSLLQTGSNINAETAQDGFRVILLLTCAVDFPAGRGQSACPIHDPQYWPWS